MTETIRTRIAQFVGVALALFAGAAVAAALASTPESGKPQVVLLVAGTAAEDPEVLARAKAASDRTGAPLRVARTTADQLGVTHLLAASGYDKVITVGVDRRIAIAPVAARFPETRFVALAN
jgi:basic membrane lipoprotein Med (substrate-binding protein (PBP1-ABC) superfamily)